MNRPVALIALMASLVIATGCAGGPQPAASPSPQASIVAVEPSPTATPAMATATPAPGSQQTRATGSGLITIDGAAQHELEVALCGWQNSGRDQALEPEPGSRSLFRLVAVRPVGAGMLGLDLDRDGRTGAITVSLIQLDPDNPSSAFRYANERQPTSAIEIDGGHVTTIEPLVVFDGLNIMTASRHELEIDVTCDSFGGSVAALNEVVAQVLGITLPTPQTSGELTLGGERFELQISSCSTSGDSEVEIEANSPDGRISLTLAARPSFTFLFVSLEGRVATPTGEIELAIDGNEVRTTTPIAVEIAGRGPSELTFNLLCGGG